MGKVVTAVQQIAPGLFVLLWSTGFIGAKLGLPYAEPLTFLLVRFSIVIMLLTAIALWLRRPWPSRPADYGHTAIAGILLHGGYLSGVFCAIHQGMSAGLSSLIVGMQPLLTAALGRVALGERMSRVQMVGLAMGFAGIWLVLQDRVSVAGLNVTSVLLACMALVSITVGTVYQKRFCGVMDLWTGSTVQFAATAVVLLPFALAIETMRIEWSGRFVFALGWLVLVLSLGAISLLHVLIKRGAATRVAALFYLTPPTTAVLAFIVFGETLTPGMLAGLVVAVAGVWLVVRR